jgi:hypothetical protein
MNMSIGVDEMSTGTVRMIAVRMNILRVEGMRA